MQAHVDDLVAAPPAGDGQELEADPAWEDLVRLTVRAVRADGGWVQLVGGAVVLTGVVLAETARR